jgi:hypothetical protein
MTLKEILKEIITFGAESTLISIENIKCPIRRVQERNLVEEAFKLLKLTDKRFIMAEWPVLRKVAI